MSIENLDMGDHVKLEMQRKFAVITLNRPQKANALTLPMVKDVEKALKSCQLSDSIVGIILTGEGSSFTTGMDINSIKPSDHSASLEYERTSASIADMLFNGKPSICAINGKAMGDGVAYSLCADYCIATKNCYFQMPEILISVFPGGRTVALMAKIIGIPWTKRILMFAEKIPAETALQIGLINEIVENKDELMTSALNKAKFLSTKNKFVLNLIKSCSNQLLDKSYAQAYGFEKETLTNWLMAKNKKDFLIKFKEKLLTS
ncbi:MAG: enoyl-CoA hydratase/isomerase family protein [Promethearchaeota archaeon]